MKSKIFYKIFKLSILIAFLVLMFYLMSQDGNNSYATASLITDRLTDLFGAKNSLIIIILTRKIAHVSEYLILSLLFYWNFKDKYLLYIFFPILLAIYDEFQQRFLPGRVGQFSDVLIDMLGILLAFVILKIYKEFYYVRKN